MAGRRWGWHELDDAWAERVVASARLPARSLVYDLGAGRGALTRPLLDAGHDVIAVELHGGRAEALRHRCPTARVVERDLRDVWFSDRPCHVVANPPFDGVGSLLRAATDRRHGVRSVTVLVERRVARAWATTRRPARWQASVELTVPRRALDPAPRVDLDVLRLTRRR